MAEEPKGVEDPSAANLEEPGVSVPEGVPLESPPAAGENQDEKIAGLTAAAVAEREKRQAVESENQDLRDQMALATPQRNEQPEAKTSLSQAVANQLGIDLEIASPAEICQVNEGVLQIVSGQQTEQSFINSHPDYSEIVGVTGPGGQFQYAPPLLRALRGNPALQTALQNSPNKAVLAYSIANSDPQYLAEKADKAKSADTKAAEKAVVKIDAANRQLSINTAKTGGGNLDDAARRAAQTDAEFLAENEKIMAKAL